jgi:anti-sigma factor RsiW
MNDDEISALIRTQATRFCAGEELKAQVRTQLALQAAAQRHQDAAAVPEAVGTRKGLRHWWAALAWPGALPGFACGVLLTLALSWLLPLTLSVQSDLPQQLVGGHVRALTMGPLIQVASSDRHTVKPWFQGKIDYAPPVEDFKADGFNLLGARLEPLQGNLTASLVYGYKQHIITVYVWPSDRSQPPESLQKRGFNLQHWSDSSMQYWVVSDADPATVAYIAKLLQQHPPG